MFFWLHLKFDDMQKWYVGGYLEIRWMSYLIGLYHLMYRFFLFITIIGRWLIICNGRRQKRSWFKTVFSTYLPPTGTLEDCDTAPLMGVCSLGAAHSRATVYLGLSLLDTESVFPSPEYHVHSWSSALHPLSYYVHILSTILALYIFFISFQLAYRSRKQTHKG